MVSFKWQSQESTRLLKKYSNEKQDKTKQNKKSFKVRDEDDELDWAYNTSSLRHDKNDG